MEQIFGKFYTNKNLAIEFSRFLKDDDLTKLIQVSKKFNQIYSQDIILWIVLQNSFPEVRCAENFLFQDKKGLTSVTAIKAFREVKKCVKLLSQNRGYKVRDENHFLVHVQGLIGKLPRSEDIKATSGENFDLLSAFQTFFVFEGDIYALTTYSCPFDRYGSYMMNEIDCFLVLGNENLYLSRKDCEDTLDMMNKEKFHNVVMLQNSSELAAEEMWPNQLAKEEQNTGKNIGGVEKLKSHLLEQNETVLELKNLSHHNISLIFNHILKACILKRRERPNNQRLLYKIEHPDSSTQAKTAATQNLQKKDKKCNIF